MPAKYTIKEAIHEEAVLGFMNEYLVDSDINPNDTDVDPAMYDRESHLLMVLNTILKRSNEKFGIQNGKEKTYEAIIYLVEVKGEDKLKDPDVIAKKERGVQYCAVASRWGKANGYKEWRYLFIPAGQIKSSSSFAVLADRFKEL